MIQDIFSAFVNNIIPAIFTFLQMAVEKIGSFLTVLFLLPIAVFSSIFYYFDQIEQPLETIDDFESALLYSVSPDIDRDIVAYTDTHDSSGGTTYAAIEYSADIGSSIVASGYWLPLPMPENLHDLLYGFTDENGVLHGGYLEYEYRASFTDKEGYFFYRNDRSSPVYASDLASPEEYDYDKEERSAWFAFAVYVPSEQSVYYYEYDD